MSDKRLTSKDWFGKVSAGLILGFLLSVGITGLIVKFGIGNVHVFSIQGQFLMWILSPIWVVTFSLCFLYESTIKAWIWLGGLNAVIWAGVYAGTLMSAGN